LDSTNQIPHCTPEVAPAWVIKSKAAIRNLM
jgi:hypothetical protein